MLQYSGQLSAVHSEIPDMNRVIKDGIKALRRKGLIEMMAPDTGTMKKSFQIKINT